MAWKKFAIKSSKMAAKADSVSSDNREPTTIICRKSVTSLTFAYASAVVVTEMASMTYLLGTIFYHLHWGTGEGRPPISKGLVLAWGVMSLSSMVTAMACMKSITMVSSVGMSPFLLYQVYLLILSCYCCVLWCAYPASVKSALDNSVMAQIPGYEAKVMAADTDTLAYVFIVLGVITLLFRVFVIRVIILCMSYLWDVRRKHACKDIERSSEPKDNSNSDVTVELDADPTKGETTVVSVTRDDQDETRGL